MENRLTLALVIVALLGAAWFTLGDWSFGEDNINIVNQLPGLSKAIASMPLV